MLFISACHNQAFYRNDTAKLTSSDCRIVIHAMGEACVPLNPQKVVVLGGTELDPVLMLEPNFIAGQPNTLTYIKEKLPNQWAQIEEIPSIGDDPNLEYLLLLKPDIILGHTSRVELIYDKLARIAPTVLSNSEDWRAVFRLFAEALGKQDLAAQILNNYQIRLAEFKQKMGDRLQKLEVSALNFRPTTISVYPSNSFCGSVLQEAGLRRPPAQEKYNASGADWEISKESFRDMDGDIIFVFTWAGSLQERLKAKSTLQKLQADPLWSQLKAVKQGKVYDVGDYWLGVGPVTANLILDDLFRYLLGST
ncbi:hypothetical protein NIES1031_03635 [Chroogloeocystis siderophila 5.2 s.c.1]|uniref:Fe/B12 periplasmic-binding domain-containing protein n=2 Tax=Chroogloeocystis TaxID=329162 RepID=A0A1U7HYA2_9CHRO|nr:hypothetical protein NIES1031_03635 [Chroogloeocystis siderophila 5.2 s.c.1]